ncbi:YetF domain-containing protein [uncultured Marinobacter sp.]|uniref:DUF421 domain-containing protein n=1 Tax=uncultured Marinobacter sp. TaxID=187379 RepID=UPI00344FCA31
MIAYTSLIACLRVSGKRTLSKMNAFDLIVTISLGSILASIMLSQGVTLAKGIVAFSLLIALQFLVTWSSVRMPSIRQLVTGEPQLLLEHGCFITDALGRTRVSESEVRAAVRAAGVADMKSLRAVVLETDGSFSVIQSNKGEPEDSSLLGVHGGLSVHPDKVDQC